MATVHQGSQFVVAATVDYDPSISAAEIDKVMEASGDFGLPRSMRQQARLWSAREYEDGICRINHQIFAKDDVAVGDQWKLPGSGARVRTDIFMHAHMLLVKKLIGSRFRYALLCLDSKAELAAATSAIFMPEILDLKVDIAEVIFAKGITNDQRNDFADRGRKIRKMLFAAIMAMQRVSELQALTSIVLKARFAEVSNAERGLSMASGLR